NPSEFKSPSSHKAGVGAGEMAPDSSSRWAAAQAKGGSGGGGASASASGSGLATPAKKVSSYGGGRYQRGSSASDGKRSSLLQRPTSEYTQETSNLRG
ncbi:unnamed protein product, partial [Ectocarpus sp. 12 AP-2014]